MSTAFLSETGAGAVVKTGTIGRHHAARSNFSMCCVGCLPVWLHRLPPRSNLAPRRPHPNRTAWSSTSRSTPSALRLGLASHSAPKHPFAPQLLRRLSMLFSQSLDLPPKVPCRLPPRRRRHAAPPNCAWQAASACRLEPQPLPRATTSEPTSRPAQPPTVHVGPLICCAVLSAPGPPASTRGALAQLLLRRPLCLDIASDSSLRNICIHLLQPARRARSSTPPSTLPVLLFSRSASRGSTGAPH